MQYPLSSLVLGPRNYVTKVTLEQGRCYDSSASLIGEPITLFELGLIKAGRIIFIARAHDFSEDLEALQIILEVLYRIHVRLKCTGVFLQETI